MFGNGGDDEFTGGNGLDEFIGGAGFDTAFDTGEAGGAGIENWARYLSGGISRRFLSALSFTNAAASLLINLII